MEASVSISACARSPIGFRRPRVPASPTAPVVSNGSASVACSCRMDSNVTCKRFDFHPELQALSKRPKTDLEPLLGSMHHRRRLGSRVFLPAKATGVPSPPLDLTEDNVNQVLTDARVELAQLFDASVGITGEVELADLDGPFVKISLRGKFWHKRSTVLARLGNYLKQRIPEILEVDIEDEKQLDDSPENF